MTCFFELSRLAVEVADFDFGQADEEELQYKTFWERLRESFGIYLYYTWTVLVSIFIQKWQSKFNAMSTWCQGKDIWKFRILENVNVSKWNIHQELQLMLLVDVKYFFFFDDGWFIRDMGKFPHNQVLCKMTFKFSSLRILANFS